MIESAIAAIAFGLSGGLSPGPLLALVVAETLARGRRAGFAVAAAPLLTDGPIIAATVLLLGRIESSEPALGIVNLAGGAPALIGLPIGSSIIAKEATGQPLENPSPVHGGVIALVVLKDDPLGGSE